MTTPTGKFGEFSRTGLLPGIKIGVGYVAPGVPPDSIALGPIKAGDQVINAIAFMPPFLSDGLIAIGTLEIGTDAVKFQTTTTAVWRMAGIQYSKVATDALTFAAADTINTAAGAGKFWGIWLVQVDPNLNVSTKSPAANQVYTTEALAIAALPSPDADNVALGYITVQSKEATKWTANTDDMTDGSDCTVAHFVDTPGSFDPNSSVLMLFDFGATAFCPADGVVSFAPGVPPLVNVFVLVFWISAQDKGTAFD